MIDEIYNAFANAGWRPVLRAAAIAIGLVGVLLYLSIPKGKKEV
jgi:hypothetical protein